MAKHRSRRRRNSNFFAYPLNTTHPLGTLAAGVITSAAMTAFGTTRVRVISADLTWAIAGSTAQEGPLRVGLTSSNLSNTEIGEALDAAPTSKADIIAIERSKRPVRSVGQYEIQSTTEVLNDGKPIRTKLQFGLDEGIELNLWVRNVSGIANLTTGAAVIVSGILYCVWL